MKKIQMVDLQSQYYKIKADVDNAVLNVLDSAAFINGPEVKSFQNELEQYLDVKHVIPCANGTDALQIALMALDLKEGDEVITADFTLKRTGIQNTSIVNHNINFACPCVKDLKRLFPISII